MPRLHPPLHWSRPKTLNRRPHLNHDEIAACSFPCRRRQSPDPMISFQPSNSIWPKAQQMRSHHFLGGKGEARDSMIPQRRKRMGMKQEEHQRTKTLFQDGVRVGDRRGRVEETKTTNREDGGTIWWINTEA